MVDAFNNRVGPVRRKSVVPVTQSEGIRSMKKTTGSKKVTDKATTYLYFAVPKSRKKNKTVTVKELEQRLCREFGRNPHTVICFPEEKLIRLRLDLTVNEQ